MRTIRVPWQLGQARSMPERLVRAASVGAVVMILCDRRRVLSAKKEIAGGEAVSFDRPARRWQEKLAPPPSHPKRGDDRRAKVPVKNATAARQPAWDACFQCYFFIPDGKYQPIRNTSLRSSAALLRTIVSMTRQSLPPFPGPRTPPKDGNCQSAGPCGIVASMRLSILRKSF